ncbi:hypothetical protein [Rhizorhapis suberifaciens]|uniref:Uncharacterized protein n=1 Tax=Rhizorhapis suberifaciens TaxID=13656 RepID=A0A840HWL7_9SPHN|nr:hypothetical protein [Rhizorhapis suberifaciens]MBB4642353.1 hypothetical protein [Rhizorhapis suberifaciens]
MTADLFDRQDALAWAREVKNPLNIEMQAASQRLQLRQMNLLRGLGLNAPALLTDNMIGTVSTEVLNKDFWQQEESGKPMLVVPLIEDGQTIDLIAFDPLDPNGWYLKTGHGFALGAEAITDAVQGWDASDQRLRMHATPLDWLRSGCDGCCVVQWTDEARAEVRHVRTLEVSSPTLARALRLELTRPPRIPEIEVKGMRSRAA